MQRLPRAIHGDGGNGHGVEQGPLHKWVLAFHLLCSSKKGFSACQLQRELGLGSYRTAWFMLHRVRHAFSELAGAKLQGAVEVDETYVGGKPRYKGPKGKRPERT